MFGLTSTLLFMAMGGGIDLSRAYLARQKLSQVATLACQYASRPAIVDTSSSSYSGSNGGATYTSNVNNFITTTWQSQKVGLVQTNAAPFNYTKNGPATVSLNSSVSTAFLQMFGFNSIPIGAQTHCYDNLTAVPQRTPNPPGQYLLRESFEKGGTSGGFTYYKPNGTIGTQSSPTSYSSGTAYTGANGVQWHVTGYCVEQDSAGVIKQNVADGGFSVELDCDNGSGNQGNSSITTLVYIPSGSYELRYNYASRVSYPNYEPVYLCSSAASDLSWANDTNSQGGPVANALRTNQMNVYLDLNNSASNVPPTHTTIDGTQQLDGSNLSISASTAWIGWSEASA